MKKLSKGFTLIELLVYLSLVSIFLSAAILFAWDIIYGRVKSQVQQEVSWNLKQVSRKLNSEIKKAKSINSINPNSISLEMHEQDKDPTVFSLDSGVIKLGFDNNQDCPIANPCNLTSNQVIVTDLDFTDMSSSTSTYVNYSFTIESNSDRKEWQMSETWEGGANLRN